MHIDDLDMCKHGFLILFIILKNDKLSQKEAYKKRYLNIILNVKNKHNTDEDILKLCNNFIILITWAQDAWVNFVRSIKVNLKTDYIID